MYKKVGWLTKSQIGSFPWTKSQFVTSADSFWERDQFFFPKAMQSVGIWDLEHHILNNPVLTLSAKYSRNHAFKAFTRSISPNKKEKKNKKGSSPLNNLHYIQPVWRAHEIFQYQLHMNSSFFTRCVHVELQHSLSLFLSLGPKTIFFWRIVHSTRGHPTYAFIHAF